MDEEKNSKASNEESKAVAEGDLAETVKGIAEDKQALETASTTCMTVAGFAVQLCANTQANTGITYSYVSVTAFT